RRVEKACRPRMSRSRSWRRSRTATDTIDAEQGALLADSVGLALLVVLDALAPAERLAFVLHDVFGVPFADIATALGRSDLYPFVRPALVNGAAGAVVAPGGRLFSVMGFTVVGGRITAIDALLDPERLARLELDLRGK